MTVFGRFKNILIARIITRFPSLSERFIDAYTPWESEDVPWTEIRKPLHECTVSIVTTSGVHHRDQVPYDMHDKNGDPSFRIIDGRRPLSDLMITHDYYDHTDADKDINIVFPVERLQELVEERIIGKLALRHFAFMGHIDGPQIPRLISKSAPEVARLLRDDGVDVVLLTPG